MDEQRCTLNISPKSTPTHRPTQDVLRKGLNLVSLLLYLYFQVFMVRYGRFKWFHYTSVTVFTFPDADPEKFFSLLANSQGRRLDDQRLSLPALPGIQNGNAKSNSASEADAGNLCNVIAKAQVGHLTDWRYKRCFQDAFQVFWSVITELEVNSGSYFFLSQGSRMDDQRCSAPQILQNLSSPSPRHKSPSVPDTSEKHQQVGKNVAQCTHCKSVIFTLRKMWHFETFCFSFGSCFKLSYFFVLPFPFFLGAVCSRPTAVPQNNESRSKGAHGWAALLFTTQQCTRLPSAKWERYK